LLLAVTHLAQLTAGMLDLLVGDLLAVELDA